MDVLISGASVAGPALAYWLRRDGHTVTVVERAHEIRPGGFAVDFRGTAMTVLDRMGILDELRAHTTEAGDSTIVDTDGNPIATMPGAVFAGDLEVMKADLTRILYDLTKDDAKYVFDDSITALTQDADRVHVEFARGASRSFDLVVGADGLHSVVRSLVFGPKEDYTHYMGYSFATFGVPNYLNLRNNGLSHVAGDRSIGMAANRGHETARAMVIFPGRDIPRDAEAQQEAIRRAYVGVGWETPRLLAAMPAAPTFYFDEMSQIVMPSWSSGRVVLLGDAGYCASPLSGRGTSQALLGAYVLAGELAARPDHTSAFAAYESALREYVAANQAMARQAIEAFLVPPTQELFDAMAAAGTDEDSTDNLSLPEYSNLTVR